jgi:hypothetical protein
MTAKPTRPRVESQSSERQTPKRGTITNRDDTSQLETLLSQPLADQHAATNKDKIDVGIQFLLTEYNSLTDLWKHTDSRFESGLNIYLAASALIASAIVFFSQRVTDINIFLGITIFIAIALAVAGKILSDRLLVNSFNKAEYIYARDLIRRFFADQSPDITPYLYFLRDKIPESAAREGNKISQLRAPKTILSVIYLWVSFLLGLIVSITTWLIDPSYPFIITIIPGIITTIALFAYFTLNKRKKIRNFNLRQYNP